MQIERLHIMWHVIFRLLLGSEESGIFKGVSYWLRVRLCLTFGIFKGVSYWLTERRTLANVANFGFANFSSGFVKGCKQVRRQFVIVAKSFSCRKEILNINFSANSCKRLPNSRKRLQNSRKRLQNSRKPLQTVVRRVAKVLFDLPMPSTTWP